MLLHFPCADRCVHREHALPYRRYGCCRYRLVWCYTPRYVASNSSRSWPYRSAEKVHMTKNQEISVVITSLSNTVLAIVSLFGSVRFVQSKFARFHWQCSCCAQIDRGHHQASQFRFCVFFGYGLALGIQHCERRVLHLYALPQGWPTRSGQLPRPPQQRQQQGRGV